jgi:hypothetical protein
MLGPATHNSPMPPGAQSPPSSLTTRISVCISALPVDPSLRIASAGSSKDAGGAGLGHPEALHQQHAPAAQV